MTNKIKRYHKVLHEWRHIPRAHEPQKPLAEKAKKILAEINLKMYPKEGCSEKDYITLNNERLSEITGCGRKQNKNLLRQLDNIFYIQFEQKFRYERKTHWNVYVIIPKHNAKEILDNPELYYSEKKTISPEKVKNIDEYPTHKFPVTQHKISTPYIYTKEYNNKNRSISNFQNFENFKEAKPLESFYPLTEEQAEELRRKSGREFNQNAMNEILRDMARRLKDKFFHTCGAFINYMAIAFRYEKRQAVAINNEGFKIKANYSNAEEEIYMKTSEIERYLSRIEKINDTSSLGQLKKKLASVLEPQTAYELLTAFANITIKNGVATVELRKQIELKPCEERLVLAAVVATHTTNILEPIFKLKIKISVYKMQANIAKPLKSTPIPRVGIWGEIRGIIVKYLGMDGEAIDRNWFSRLEAEIDENTKQIKLKAPNSLFKSRVEDNYEKELRNAALSKGFNIKEIYCY